MNDSLILKISVIFTIASFLFILLFVMYLDEDLRKKIFRKRKNNVSKNRKRCEEKMLKAASRGSTAKSEIDIASIYFISAMIEVSDLSLVKTNYALICDIFSYAIWVMKTMNNRFSFFECIFQDQ